VFTFPLIEGNSTAVLNEPNTVVLSASTAKKFFGEEDPLGRELLMYDGNTSVKVTGIMADMPANSHFQFDVLVSMSTFPESRNPSWMVSEFYTYLLLQPGSNYKRLEETLRLVTEKYMGPQLQEAMGISYNQFRQAGNSIGLFLQPLKSIHLHSDMRGELGSGGDIRYVYIFGAVAVFMLLIACINFMNLSTAGASKRAKEVGVRKVMGSARGQLVGQFLTESVLLSLMAMGIALVLVKLALPTFNTFSGKNIDLSYLANIWTLPSLLMLGVVVGILAGIYPAFFLSSYKAISVLKGSSLTTSGEKGKSGISLRSSLVVFQFSVSGVLIIATLVVYRQLGYIQNKNLGYEK